MNEFKDFEYAKDQGLDEIKKLWKSLDEDPMKLQS